MQEKRAALLEPICDFLLDNGLEAANLRALAKAAGTSDRMLLYYFKDKDDLVRASFKRLGERLAERLTVTLPDTRMDRDDLVAAVWQYVQTPPLWAYMVLFIEIVARSARGDPLYQAASRAMTDDFITWISAFIITDEAGEQEELAIEALTMIDGRVLMKLARSDVGTE